MRIPSSRIHRCLGGAAVLLAVAGVTMILAVPSQSQTLGAVGATYEDYAFGDGYVLGSISQFTTPIALRSQLGDRVALNLSTGHAYVVLDSREEAQVRSQSLRGPLDTDFRVDISATDRVLLFVSGTIPTGRETVVEDRLSLLNALSNDVIGFSATSFGAGGQFSVGASTALPIGRMALGIALLGQYNLAYTPVASESADLRPGAEGRLRLGLQGPVASRTYLRISGSLIGRQKDRLGDLDGHGVGHRLVGLVSVEQGLGRALMTVYAFDIFRSSPQLSSTALGSATLPRGNLLSAGISVSLPVDGATTLAAHGDYRVSAAATDEGSEALLRQGTMIRAEGSLQRKFGDRLVVSLSGGLATGEVRQSAQFYSASGFRASLGMQVTP